MERLKQAYAVLGVPETASKEEVEKRYFILVRRARAQQLRGETETAQEAAVNLEAVNEAYRFIREHEDQKAQTQFNEQNYGKYKRFGRFAEKIDHFFHYYKFHVIGAIVIILIVMFGVRDYLSNKAEQERLANLPPANLSVSFFGVYLHNGDDDYIARMEEVLLAEFPEWQRIVADHTYAPIEPASKYDVDMIQKSILDLMTKKHDVYILDQGNFDKLTQLGMFIKLDDIVEDLQPLLSPESVLKGQTRDDAEEHIYGIDISHSPSLQKLPLNGQQYIAAIRNDSMKTNNAIHFIVRMLQSE